MRVLWMAIIILMVVLSGCGSRDLSQEPVDSSEWSTIHTGIIIDIGSAGERIIVKFDDGNSYLLKSDRLSDYDGSHNGAGDGCTVLVDGASCLLQTAESFGLDYYRIVVVHAEVR